MGAIHAGITDEQRAEWLASDAVNWANESFAIAREPDFGYCLVIGDACLCEADNPELDDGEPEKVVVIDDAYLDSPRSGRAGANRDGRCPIGGAA